LQQFKLVFIQGHSVAASNASGKVSNQRFLLKKDAQSYAYAITGQ
jgi:hypothetical protein